MRKFEKPAAVLFLFGVLLLGSCRDNKPVTVDSNTPSTEQNETNRNGEEYFDEVSVPESSQNNQDRSDAKGGQTDAQDPTGTDENSEHSAPQNR